jgi:hypothetical protein
LFYVLKCDLFWRKFLGLLRRMCILWLLGKYMSIKTTWSIVLINSDIFCLNNRSIGKNGVLKSSTFIVLRSICFFTTSMFALWNSVHQLSVHILTSVISPCWICSLYQNKVTLSLLTNFYLNSSSDDLLLLALGLHSLGKYCFILSLSRFMSLPVCCLTGNKLSFLVF